MELQFDVVPLSYIETRVVSGHTLGLGPVTTEQPRDSRGERSFIRFICDIPPCGGRGGGAREAKVDQTIDSIVWSTLASLAPPPPLPPQGGMSHMNLMNDRSPEMHVIA